MGHSNRSIGPAVRKGGRLAAAMLVSMSVLLLIVLGLGPHTGTYRTQTVLSGSMEPAIKTGSVAIVVPVPSESLTEGDVLVFHPPGEDRTVSHRIVEVVESGPAPVVRTKGDANRVADPGMVRVTSEPAWVVRTTIPGLGYGVLWLRQPWARQAAIFGAPAILAALWLQQIWRRPEGEPEREDVVSEPALR